jgi:hypothetical protein
MVKTLKKAISPVNYKDLDEEDDEIDTDVESDGED